MGLPLVGDQMALGDLDLLVLRVARQPDDLHAVQQRRGNVHGVGGRDEHDAREIVVDLEVVVVERMVLLRIEHLQERRRRIAAEIGPHLVNFVQ